MPQKKKRSQKDENRRLITEKNAECKKAKAQKRLQRLLKRTQELQGQNVIYRSIDGPGVGIVKEILKTRPEGAKRRGSYLMIQTPKGDVIRPRSRIKKVDGVVNEAKKESSSSQLRQIPA